MPTVRSKCVLVLLLCVAFSTFCFSHSTVGSGLMDDRLGGPQTHWSSKASRQYAGTPPGPGCTQIPLNDSALAAALDSFISEYMSCLNLGGVQVGLIRGGKVVYSKGFGIADAQTQRPVDTETLFGIGSTSKAFTSLLLGQLVEAGALSFDDPVSRILPQFHLFDPAASSIATIRDILSHRTGLPRHDMALWILNKTRESLIPQAVYLPPTNTIRNQWQYSNWMVSVAGSIAAWLNGFGTGAGAWESLVHRNIFDALNMSLTTANFSEAISVSNRANVVYSTAPGQWANGDWNANLIIDVAAPAGGINSCVEDMLKWIQVHLNNSKVPLVSTATLAELHRGNIVVNLPGIPADLQHFFLGNEYGLNWIDGAYRGHRRVQHDGGTVGFTTLVSMLPDDGIGFFAVTNSEDAPSLWHYTLSTVAFDLALGLEPVFNVTTACNSPCSIFPDYPPCKALGSAQITLPTAIRPQAVKKRSVIQHDATVAPTAAADYVALYLHPAYGQINVSLDNGRLQATSWLSLTGEPITTPLSLIRGELFNWIGNSYAGATIEFVRTQRVGTSGAVISLTLYYVSDSTEYHISFTNSNFQVDDQSTACSFSSTSGIQYVSTDGRTGPQGATGSNGQSSDLTAGMLALTIVLSVLGSSSLAAGIALWIVMRRPRGLRNPLLNSTE